MVNHIKPTLDSSDELSLSSQHWTVAMNHGEPYQVSIGQQE
jgi:hypothetical protein